MQSKINVSLLKNSEKVAIGHQKIDWVAKHMPILNRIKEEFSINKPFLNHKVGICLHLEAKTAYMASILLAGGADVFVCGSNPLTTQDDVAVAIAERGVHVYAWYNASSQEYYKHIDCVLDAKPNLIIDDGGDLVTRLHSTRKEILPYVLGGTEETSTGIQRLKSLQKEGLLSFPMIAVNDTPMKHLFDNRYGTAQSSLDGFLRTTNMTISGKVFVVAGYGWCGKGIASRAKGLGANVVICEIDPIKANEAIMEGFRVMPMLEAAAIGDIFITVTGCFKIITREHFISMKNGAILMNAGHFDCEVFLPDLEELSIAIESVKPNIMQYTFADGREIFVLASGRLVNLAAADGHPIEIIDLSFSLQVLSLHYLLKNKSSLPSEIINVPKEIDENIAYHRLEALGVKIDALTAEQKKYIQSWEI